MFVIIIIIIFILLWNIRLTNSEAQRCRFVPFKNNISKFFIHFSVQYFFDPFHLFFFGRLSFYKSRFYIPFGFFNYGG